MKNIMLSGVVAALLVFSGCSSKEPAVDTPDVNNSVEEVAPQAQQEVTPVESETVSDEESVVMSDQSETNMESIESKLPTVYFAFDKYNITPEMQEKIDKAAELGKPLEERYRVQLEGNCDEWGSDEYNFALGLKRANAVKQALVADGIDASRISMVSYGESNPVCTEHTKACWAKNRRVNFKVLP